MRIKQCAQCVLVLTLKFVTNAKAAILFFGSSFVDLLFIILIVYIRETCRCARRWSQYTEKFIASFMALSLSCDNPQNMHIAYMRSKSIFHMFQSHLLKHTDTNRSSSSRSSKKKDENTVTKTTATICAYECEGFFEVFIYNIQ